LNVLYESGGLLESDDAVCGFDFSGDHDDSTSGCILDFYWSQNGVFGSNSNIMLNAFSKFKDDIKHVKRAEDFNVLSDIYGSLNISMIEIGIKKEHLENAPIHIKASFLQPVLSSGVFEWMHDDAYDFDITGTYEDDFESVKDEKYFVHQFSALSSQYNMHCFGLELEIDKIVPQTTTSGTAIIDDLKIKCSNIISDGTSKSVNDVYVRKCDANCRNYYSMDVSEYVWRLPKSASEWDAVCDALNKDAENKLLDKDDFDRLSSFQGGSILTGRTLNNVGVLSSNTSLLLDSYLMSTPVSAQTSGQIDSNKNFSLMDTFYITNDPSNRSIKEVISDNYLSEGNMKVTWKYVDYVYISYSCYGKNSRILLEKYFGDKIVKAVKSKLINNIESLNANSAFKDKFEFSGGLYVSKEEDLNEDQHTDVFKWNSSYQIEKNWSKVYTKTTTEMEIAIPQPIYEVTTSVVEDKYKNGNFDSSRTISSSTTLEGQSKIEHKTLVDITSKDRLDKVVNHYGAAIVNSKYSSVENWMKSIHPIMLKYKIN